MGVYARTQALTNLGRYDDALNVIIKANPKSYKSEFLMQRIKVLATNFAARAIATIYICA